MLDLSHIHKEQKEFFDSKKTISIKFRKESLRRLSKSIKNNETSRHVPVTKVKTTSLYRKSGTKAQILGGFA